MILAIDAGNSRIKWGLANEGGWQRLGAIPTREVGQLDVALADLMPPEMVVISNVAGASVGSLLAQVVSRFAVPVIWTKACEQQCGISSSYALPMQLGSDRWASLIGAWNFYHSACVVVNAGTTMTVDALTSEGIFLGGVIVPGLDLMSRCLEQGAAQLQQQPGAFRYFPDNTADAMFSGAINASVGAIERMRDYLEKAVLQLPIIVLSGGAASILSPELKGGVECVDYLVLEGLLVIARQG